MSSLSYLPVIPFVKLYVYSCLPIANLSTLSKMFLFFTSLIVKSECSSVYCLNGGTCRDEPTGYHCDCQFGFYGKRCEGRLKKQASHRTYLQYKSHSHLLESNLVFIHSPLSKIHLFVSFLHKASIDSLFLALLDHGKKGKVLLHGHSSKHQRKS